MSDGVFPPIDRRAREREERKEEERICIPVRVLRVWEYKLECLMSPKVILTDTPEQREASIREQTGERAVELLEAIRYTLR